MGNKAMQERVPRGGFTDPRHTVDRSEGPVELAKRDWIDLRLATLGRILRMRLWAIKKQPTLGPHPTATLA